MIIYSRYLVIMNCYSKKFVVNFANIFYKDKQEACSYPQPSNWWPAWLQVIVKNIVVYFYHYYYNQME